MFAGFYAPGVFLRLSKPILVASFWKMFLRFWMVHVQLKDEDALGDRMRNLSGWI